MIKNTHTQSTNVAIDALPGEYEESKGDPRTTAMILENSNAHQRQIMMSFTFAKASLCRRQFS